MQLTREVLADMVARASTVDERLQNGYLIPHPEQREHDVDQRLARWCQCAAKNDAHFFAKLLAARGLDIDSARRGLAAVTISSPELPPWTELISECVTAANQAAANSGRVYRFLLPDESIRFEQVIAPFVEVGARRLRKSAGTSYALLEAKAHSAIERMLLLWLTGPLSSALLNERSLFHLRPDLRQTAALVQGELSPDVDAQFAQFMLGEKLPSFLHQYCVLARIIATLLEHWVTAISEFLRRLEQDCNELALAFHDGRSLGRVADLKAGLSDPHEGGRTVLALKFESGLKVMYKPKKLDPEFGFNKLVEWLNGRGLELKLSAPKVLLRSEYGWVEYIDYRPCSSETELERFYRRGGMLLALFHVLESTDVHGENLIASGEFPMLVDAEALITPRIRPASSAGVPVRSEERVAWHLQDSVLKTGMLPNWRGDSPGSDYDLSGLGGVGGEEVDVLQWAPIQGRSSATGRVRIQRGRNVPFPPDQNPEPERFVESIAVGFEDAYRVLMEERQALLEEGGPLDLLRQAPMRLVFRETQIYYKILKKSIEPDLLQDAADRSVELEVLSRILCASDSSARSLPLVESERRSIEQLDIPVFHSFPAARELLASGRPIAMDYFRESAYEQVAANLRELSDARCAEQCTIIRGCFYAKALNQRARSLATHPEITADILRGKAHLDTDALLEAAVQIAETLRREALWGDGGDASWFGIYCNRRSNSYRYGAMPEDLREGQAGIALFFAALAWVTEREDFRTLAASATVPLKRLVAFACDDAGWKKVNEGKWEAANLIDPLVRLARLLHDDSLLGSALEAAHLVTPSLLNRDHHSACVHDTAAIALALCSLFEECRDPFVLERAVLCCEQLSRNSHEDDPRLADVQSRLSRVTELDPLEPPRTAQFVPPAGFNEGSSEELLGKLRPLDSMRNGNFGLIAQAIDAAERLGRPDLVVQGRSLAHAAVERARISQGYRLFEALPAGVPCFGFLHGLAGIGYTLSRAHDTRIPGVSLWN